MCINNSTPQFLAQEEDMRINKNESTYGNLTATMLKGSYAVAQNTWRDRASINFNPFLICFTQKTQTLFIWNAKFGSSNEIPVQVTKVVSWHPTCRQNPQSPELILHTVVQMI
jgi:hypothetical protein